MNDSVKSYSLLKHHNSNQVLIPVILSGGGGSRLWPISREDSPKPFIKLTDGQSLLEKTYRRAAKLLNQYKNTDKIEIITVTNRNYYYQSCNELRKVGNSGIFLLEPCSRNTASAIALAAHYICNRFGQDAIMLVLAADHLISDYQAFSRAVEDAIQLAKSPNKLLVTFGIVPTRPETGFGYIQAGEKIEKGFKVKAFIEKPDAITAQTYIDDGHYFWNSGMFCFCADVFLKQLEIHMTDFSHAVKECWKKTRLENYSDLTRIEIPEEPFNSLPDISVDYAVMEKSNEVAVISADFDWRDIGSWSAIQELSPKDENGNYSTSEAIFINSNNTYVQSKDRIVATVGVSNLIIIDTKDALLVVNPLCTQDVKEVIYSLKGKNHHSFKHHQSVIRPWGIYTILEESKDYKIKKIEVNPGASLSLQSHKYRSEHWVVVKGIAYVINGKSNYTLSSNQSTYIPAGVKHRLENPTDTDLILIEVQCGEYIGEDDITRYEDIYGRS